MSTWVSFLGFLAAGIGIVSSLPQVIRLMRSPHADGVSFSSSVLAVLSSGTWLGYGLLMRDPAQIVSNLPGLVLAVMVAVLVANRQRLPLGPAAAGVLAWAAGAAMCGLVAGGPAVGAAATLVCVLAKGPQVGQVFRGESLAGLSPWSFLLSIFCSTLWVTYGLLVGEPSVWVCSMLTGSLSTLVLVRRCPPRRVAVALHHGRWGVAGQLLVRPLAAAYRIWLGWAQVA